MELSKIKYSDIFLKCKADDIKNIVYTNDINLKEKCDVA